MGRRLADFFQGRPKLTVAALLAAPLGWLVIGYLGSLGVMLAASFWHLNELSGEVTQGFSLDNFDTILSDDVYRTITLRTIGVAAAVTVTDAILAFPIAFYMAKLARPKVQSILVVAVLLPLWSSYLVKVGAWRLMLSEDGAINWALEPFGLHGPGYGTVAVWLVMSYIWLPYMIIPIYAGLERIPDSLLSASEDLGAKPGRTFRKVIMPLTFPAIVAGSIFTFSLTLGDYITPANVGDKQFIGNVVYSNFVANLPLAAAITVIPIVVMIIYLLIARRFGAFEHV
ncbi:MAG TPA: ABC transporter permease [Solirubrobacterales bacterium]|nr:ABC transporter permease [Solirubrobacterales bacterium]HMX72447.1 ABC transporter permease [Solirubrobacterales bacterium]HNA25068.1 ABC transporter permease [Solirubrobacterales bacterium]HNA45344.1 ABC transporter permease [Solirubrobacterales bacterium]HNC06398.1 ABC transporter permease [Solirubrobacterales bacterium]